LPKKGPKPRSIEERFWNKVNKHGPIHPILGTPCWIWGKGLGYGTLKDSKRKISSHRLSYELHFGALPKGVFVCHHCDNPPCCNPKHLFIGSHSDNLKDMASKGRGRKNYDINGESNPAAKLTTPQVLEIRRLADEKTPRKQLAKQFNVSLPLIEKIISRSVWSHV
jgi:hypothetical protein